MDFVTPFDFYLLLAASSHFQWRGLKTYVQKVLYCAEDDAIREQSSPFPTFSFFRWNHGPFSKEVAQSAASLAERGFLASQAGPITARGNTLVAELRPVVRRHPVAAAALANVDRYATRFASMPLKAMLREVYARPAEGPFGPTTVEHVSEGTDMIYRNLPLDVESAHEELFDLIRWRLAQTPEEERAERESPLLPPDRAQSFLSRYLA